MDEQFTAYVDGFNLYKGLLERNPGTKWLDIVSYCQALEPSKRLVHVKYFTARVKRRFDGDLAPERQDAYLRLLKDQGVEVMLGKFSKNFEYRRVSTSSSKSVIEPSMRSFLGLTGLAFKGSLSKAKPDVPKAAVIRFEEKGSDVNLAAHLLRDTYEHGLRSALVVTGDSDLALPISFARDSGVYVRVLIPNPKQRYNELQLAASIVEVARLDQIREHQHRMNYVTSKGGTIRVPQEWLLKQEPDLSVGFRAED